MNPINGISRRNFLKLSLAASAMMLAGMSLLKKGYAYVSIKSARTKGTYDQDAIMKLRKSQDNPEIKQIYKSFLGEPNSHKAHELLHTHYVNRSGRLKELDKLGLKLRVGK